MNNRRELGDWGEEKAARYLRRKGYRILDRNFSCRQGEIDIIAEKSGVVAFVEVKLRKNADFAQAREFVTARKQARILAAARLWRSVHDCEEQRTGAIPFAFGSSIWKTRSPEQRICTPAMRAHAAQQQPLGQKVEQ